MEYIIIGLLVIILILVVIGLFKNINEANITDRLGRLEVNITKDLSDFKSSLNKDFNELSEKQDKRLMMIMIRLMKD